jgi:pimeloyl-ACP methyl ester carboxylesterase
MDVRSDDMKFLYIGLGILFFIVILVLVVSFICFRIAFFSKREKEISDEFSLPDGEIYKAYKDVMQKWADEVLGTETERVEITSFDGLKLKGKFYEYKKGAPIELMLHGYRGRAERDLCGGVQRCFALGRSALLVDQRGCGHSDGKIISFGIKEKRDCLDWIDFMINHFGSDVKIILTGISMGASTVLMAAGEELPENVVGVLADCGFTSPDEIIAKVGKDSFKINAKPLIPFLNLACKFLGKFSITELSTVDTVKNTDLPIMFIHGEKDTFVPCEMTKTTFKNCKDNCRMFLSREAGHGTSFLLDTDPLINELKSFLNLCIEDL